MRRGLGGIAAGLSLTVLSFSCEPKLVVGSLGANCVPDGADASGDSVGVGSEDIPVEVPWATGFETGFCDYEQSGGFCYSSPDATYEIVNAPVHAGQQAAAFTVTADPSRDGAQARCVRQGALPQDAFYTAWFYLPSLAESTGNWNLMHFQGGVPGEILHGLWDVSLGINDDGSAFVYLLDFLGGGFYSADPAPPVPVESWFQVELRLLRAADPTGEVALYQDGVLLVELTGLVTDDTGFAQWYVGNYAEGVTPPDSILYVDDVAIRIAP